MRNILLLSLIIGLVSCGTIYRSPKVVPGVSDGTNVRVVPINGETVIQANRSPYNPKELPAVFSFTAGDGAGRSVRTGGPAPEAPSTQDATRASLRLRPPPRVSQGPYTIGIGDVLVLSTQGNRTTVEELTGLLAAQNSRVGYTVQDDGAINIPDVGRVRLAGLTLDEAEARLFQRLVENQIDPTFSLEISEFNSRRVSIGGAVQKPGVFPITLTRLTLSEALAAAGSVSVKQIDLGSVLIFRAGEIYEIPLTSLYASPELQDTQLIAGDSVFVSSEYQLDRAEKYFEQQIALRNLRSAERAAAISELNTEIELRRDNLDEARTNYLARLDQDAVDRDYVYVTGEVETQSRFVLPFGRRASLADALYSESGGVAKLTGDVSHIYVLRNSTNPRELGAVTAWHLDARNAAVLAQTARFELRPNDVIFIAENPVTRWGRTVNQITPSLITAPISALN